MIGPDFLDAVLERSTGRGSRVHGPAHWAGVAAAGLTVLDGTPGADPLVVLLFALFHDSMRLSDGRDPEHGERAARLARELRDAGAYTLDEERLARLEDALMRHDRGETSADPTTGTCWDSDRLNLGRVCKRPDPALLSTPAARRMAATRAPYTFHVLALVWRAIFADYGAMLGELPGRPVYLRFGELPESGRSSTGLLIRECGVSVYPGVETGGSYALDFRRLLTGIDTRYLTSILWRSRPLFLVEGRRIGLGGMGEPCLADARIVGEVAPGDVEALPDRPRFRELLEAWRAKRRGADPGSAAFLGAREPNERPMFPLAPGAFGPSGFAGSIGRQFREVLDGFGVLEDYDRMRADMRTKSSRPVLNPEQTRTLAAVEDGTRRWQEAQERHRREAEAYAGQLSADPFAPDRWAQEYRVLEEQQKAMQAEYERWTGGW